MPPRHEDTKKKFNLGALVSCWRIFVGSYNRRRCIMKYIESLNQALLETLMENEHAILIGEDIRDPYGGAFKVTRGLSTKVPDRVINTPISEASIVGVATGLALRGFLPIVEIMFGDFLMLAADQIVNHTVKFNHMYNGRVTAPVVIRTPMGGYRGYGPTHSQSLEKHFLGTPGLTIVGASPLHDPGAVLKRCITEHPHPILFLEFKMLYGQDCGKAARKRLPDYAIQSIGGLSPTLVLSNNDFEAADVTVATYGELVPMVIEACTDLLIKEELFSEIIVPSQLYPFDHLPVVESLRKTGRLVTVEEGTLFSGWGAEVVARVSESAGCDLRSEPKRVGALNRAIPNHLMLEKAVLPGRERVEKEILSVMMR